MLRKDVALSLLLLAVAACEQSVERPPPTDSTSESGLARRLGFSEFPKNDGLGYTNFYIGKQVLEEVDATGDFIARPDVTYSMIRVRETVVDKVRMALDSQTLSLCVTENDIELFHNVVSETYEAEPADSVNCTPWVMEYDGRLTVEYYSGQEGVYGFVQIGRLENGNLFASARMHGLLPGTCDGGGIGRSSMTLGQLGTSVAPDEEIVQSCTAPGWH